MRGVRVGLVLASLVIAGRPAAACPFCSAQGQTLSGEVAQADLIFLGKVKSSQRDPDDFSRATSILSVDSVIKSHDYLQGRHEISIPRYIPVNPKEKDVQLIIFCNVQTRALESAASAVASSLILANPAAMTLDAYRGDPLPPKSELGKYLQGAMQAKEKDPVSRLRFFFEYLDANELLISTDALMEFGNADYKDVRKLAETLPATKILKWLQDPNTPKSRLGLYGLLIGHCGKKEQTTELKKLVTDPENAYSSGLDGMLAGLILLDPKDGWDVLMALARDRKKEFTSRFNALKVMRFLHDYRPDVIPRDQLLEGLRVLVEQDDIADLPIEDLRKWKAWDQTNFVLKFATAESHKINIVRRAILRFALSASNENKDAAEYVNQMRKIDPERVKLVEEMLRDEEPRKK